MPHRFSCRITAAALAAALALASFQSAARTPEEVRAACRAEGRPCVGLVLSGGGARGFAHVGVIKVLEELGIRVDVVTGTSMGSMVGGAYAAGFTSEELERTVLEVDWDKMLAGRAEREMLSWRRKADDYKGLPSGGVEISREGTPRLPESFVPSEELELFLARKTEPVAKIHNLSDLPIPFAAPATNLVTGKRVIMQEDCTLSEAMRASMSVPGAFAPSKYHGELLVDGGLIDNLPVSLARSMGADIIIAVNVGTPLSGRDELTNVVGVMAQMVNLLTEQNVMASLSELTDKDILIKPDLSAFTSADLKKSKEIIAAGEAAGREAAERLRALASDKAQWTAWNEARTKDFLSFDRSPKIITSVTVAQGKNPAVPEQRILDRADVRVGRRADREQLDNAARAVWADGWFDNVVYRLEPGPDGMAGLVIEPEEKGSGYASLRIGGSLETDFDSISTFSLVFAHTWHLLNEWGGEWRNEIQLGDQQRVLSEFYQPLGTALPLFVMPRASFDRSSYDVYDGDDAVATWRNTMVDAGVLFGWEWQRLGYAGISGGWLSARTNSEIGRDDPPWRSLSAPYFGGELTIDTLDNVSFPTSGMRFKATGKITDRDLGNQGGSHLYSVSALVPWSVGRWTAVTEAEVSRSTIAGAFKLGGAGRMAGVPYGRWSGSRLEYARFTLSRNISDFVPLNAPVWLSGTGEIGRAWNTGPNSLSDEDPREWHSSVSAAIGIDSIVGPVFLSIGRTMDEGTGVYFRWGNRL